MHCNAEQAYKRFQHKEIKQYTMMLRKTKIKEHIPHFDIEIATSARSTCVQHNHKEIFMPVTDPNIDNKATHSQNSWDTIVQDLNMTI